MSNKNCIMESLVKIDDMSWLAVGCEAAIDGLVKFRAIDAASYLSHKVKSLNEELERDWKPKRFFFFKNPSPNLWTEDTLLKHWNTPILNPYYYCYHYYNLSFNLSRFNYTDRLNGLPDNVQMVEELKQLIQASRLNTTIYVKLSLIVEITRYYA